jgi:hypothetical protein
MTQRHSIEPVPLLMRGKHRTPRHGACFMEFASYLSGERWSDHPACTHPLLASLARQVNDCVSNDVRQTLLDLVPDVIGLNTTDLRADLVIALRAATTALPVVSAERQHVMALAVSTCERLLAEIEGGPGAPLSIRSQLALASAPEAAAWAQRHRGKSGPSARVFRRETAPAIVRYAVDGIWQSCTSDPDRLLRELLVGAIEDCRAYAAPAHGHPVEPPVDSSGPPGPARLAASGSASSSRQSTT